MTLKTRLAQGLFSLAILLAPAAALCAQPLSDVERQIVSVA
jgi:hypothetical protein